MVKWCMWIAVVHLLKNSVSACLSWSNGYPGWGWLYLFEVCEKPLEREIAGAENAEGFKVLEIAQKNCLVVWKATV